MPLKERVNRYLKEHKRLFYYYAIRYYLKFKGISPDGIAKVKEPKKKIREVPNIEKINSLLEKIKDYCNRDTYWVLVLAYLTGRRISEILSLKVGNIKEKHIVFEMPKIQAEIQIEIDENILANLKKYLVEEKGLFANERCFFTNTKSVIVAYRILRRDLDRLAEKGILSKEEVAMLKRTHNFRRAVINYILVTIGNVIAAKEYAGHSSINSTLRYVSEQTKEKALRDACKVMKAVPKGL